MSAVDAPVAKNNFQLGYRFQNYWDASMATAFFFCELGAGLFLISLYYGATIGMVFGLIFVSVFKPYFHLAHMGVPSRSWRAILRPDRSWISRGFLALAVFISSGFVFVAQHFFPLDIWLGSWAAMILKLAKLVVVASGLVVISYQGFLMSHSSSFALWNNGIVPLSSMSYGLLSGSAAMLFLSQLGFAGNITAEQVGQLTQLVLLFLVINIVVIVMLIHSAYHGPSGARYSIDLLLKERFAKWFIPFVIVLGLVTPTLLLALLPPSLMLTLVVTVCALVGFYSYRVLMFKAAVFEPIISFAPAVMR